MYTRKKQNFVNFDLRNLNLSHYVVPGFDNQFSHFNLYAVSNHFGNLEGGHYTAYASSDVLKKWYKFDDQVRTVTPHHCSVVCMCGKIKNFPNLNYPKIIEPILVLFCLFCSYFGSIFPLLG